MKLIAACSAVCALVWPAGAVAGTANLKFVYPPPDSREQSPTVFMSYVAAPAELNDLTVRRESDDGYSFVFHDGGAPLKASGECRSVDQHTARCNAYGISPLTTVDGGDGNDRLDVQVPLVTVRGGSGDDTLVGGASDGESLLGGPGADVLLGGPGNDVLAGGAGRDSVSGAGGDDVLVEGPDSAGPAADVLDGGPGFDQVWYAERKQPVAVDLRRARPQGARGERDTFQSIEGVTGGRAKDLLVGDAGANVFNGIAPREPVAAAGDLVRGLAGDDTLFEGGGDGDVLDGGDGADRLEAASGHDRLVGGPGDDQLHFGVFGFHGRTGGLAQCGAGEDVVNPLAARVVVPRSCERASGDGVEIETSSWTASRTALELPLRAVAPFGTAPAPRSVVVTLRGPSGRVIGRAEVMLSEDADTVGHIPLNGRGRKLLARPGPARVQLSTRAVYGCPLYDCRNYPQSTADPVGAAFTLVV